MSSEKKTHHHLVSTFRNLRAKFEQKKRKFRRFWGNNARKWLDFGVLQKLSRIFCLTVTDHDISASPIQTALSVWPYSELQICVQRYGQEFFCKLEKPNFRKGELDIPSKIIFQNSNDKSETAGISCCIQVSTVFDDSFSLWVRNRGKPLENFYRRWRKHENLLYSTMQAHNRFTIFKKIYK